MNELLMAFLLGLLSAPHCVGMCGSVASALLLSSRSQQAQPLHWQAAAPALSLQPGAMRYALTDALSLGSGKLLAYASLGALAGAGSAMLHGWGNGPALLLRLLAALLMIAIGLNVAGWWRGLSRLEAAGARLLRPLLRGLARLNTGGSGGRVIAGATWGLLPCGIVYSMLGLALASGSALQGAALMASFGLGTLPFVLATGGLVQVIAPRLAAPHVRAIAGLGMIALGTGSLLLITGVPIGIGLPHASH
ncbi:MAG: sulfite exporter TauE/SafE family protein [Pseudomonadales bacterium]|nr:sulfite exporter TauE/SafE family protein [Pseudomonadales bacterium]MCP5330443.1 sulfite exporter TauE/SafE family protein [Pseudomonadales bacterium]MCP5343944.1 sulfite exporter TauE/SafE family protein [Pseudomonadales bacterium]